jgi:hypothetical protein
VKQPTTEFNRDIANAISHNPTYSHPYLNKTSFCNPIIPTNQTVTKYYQISTVSQTTTTVNLNKLINLIPTKNINTILTTVIVITIVIMAMVIIFVMIMSMLMIKILVMGVSLMLMVALMAWTISKMRV